MMGMITGDDSTMILVFVEMLIIYSCGEDDFRKIIFRQNLIPISLISLYMCTL